MLAHPVTRTKTMEFPSGSHAPAPISVGWSPDMSCCGAPPFAETTRILDGTSVKRICFPSGDQRGSWAFIGANVNWRRSLPSSLLRHRLHSGNVVYTIHRPSGETSSSPADMPPRKGTNCFDLLS